MTATNYNRILPVSDGCGSIKLMSITGTGSSNVVRLGYGGPQGIMLTAAKASAGLCTDIDFTIQGRVDETCPWFDLLNFADGGGVFPVATSEGANLGLRERSSESNGAGSWENWPEMRCQVDTFAGTGPVDVWLSWGLGE